MIVPWMRWYSILRPGEEGVDSLGRGEYQVCRATARVVLRSEVKIVDV